jgi:hypothetical protein
MEASDRQRDIHTHAMTWPEALERVVAATLVERYRDLCSDAYPDHEAWRGWIVTKARELEALPQVHDDFMGRAIMAADRLKRMPTRASSRVRPCGSCP